MIAKDNLKEPSWSLSTKSHAESSATPGVIKWNAIVTT